MKNRIFVTIFFFLILSSSEHSSAGEKMILTALNSMERIGQNQKTYGATSVKIESARNEVESFQVVVAAPEENINVIKMDVSELIGQDGSKIGKDNIRLFREEYVRVRIPTPRAELPPGLYPDPLVPFINPITGKPIEPLTRTRKRWGEPVTTSGYDMYAVPFEVFKGQNQAIWIDVHVPKNVPAGIYSGQLSVLARGGISEQIPVDVTVWDFTLPDGPTHRNHFGSFGNVARYFNIERNSDRFKQIEMRYCQAMAGHRINPPIPNYLLPQVNDDGSLKIIPERHRALKDFIETLHVTDFEIPRARFARLPGSTLRPDYKTISPDNRQKAQRYYKEFYKYLKDNGWEKRAYCWMSQTCVETMNRCSCSASLSTKPCLSSNVWLWNRRTCRTLPGRISTQQLIYGALCGLSSTAKPSTKKSPMAMRSGLIPPWCSARLDIIHNTRPSGIMTLRTGTSTAPSSSIASPPGLTTSIISPACSIGVPSPRLSSRGRIRPLPIPGITTEADFFFIPESPAASTAPSLVCA